MRAIIGIALFLVVTDHGQFNNSPPETREWFKSLRSMKGPCCSFADGISIADADWDMKEGHYWVRVPRWEKSDQMIWVPVPDEAVITEPNRVGRTIVWPYWLPGYGVSIRCFMPGTMT